MLVAPLDVRVIWIGACDNEPPLTACAARRSSHMSLVRLDHASGGTNVTPTSAVLSLPPRLVDCAQGLPSGMSSGRRARATAGRRC